MCAHAKPSVSSRQAAWFQRWMKEVWYFLQNFALPCKKQTTCLLTYLSVKLLCSHSAKNYNFFPWQPICCWLVEMDQVPRGLHQFCNWPRGRRRLCFGEQGTGSRVKWNEVLVWTNHLVKPHILDLRQEELHRLNLCYSMGAKLFKARSNLHPC